MVLKRDAETMAGLLYYTLMVLIVTCLSVSADPLKQKPQTLNFSPTRNAQQQVSNGVKQDVVPIFFYSREDSLDGDYNFKYETGNGIYAEERGVMTNKGTENEANSVVGSYKYISPEGVPIEVTYTAGVDGFKAYGAHLPVPPNGYNGAQFRTANVNFPSSFADNRPLARVLNSVENRQNPQPAFTGKDDPTGSQRSITDQEKSQQVSINAIKATSPSVDNKRPADVITVAGVSNDATENGNVLPTYFPANPMAPEATTGAANDEKLRNAYRAQPFVLPALQQPQQQLLPALQQPQQQLLPALQQQQQQQQTLQPSLPYPQQRAPTVQPLKVVPTFQIPEVRPGYPQQQQQQQWFNAGPQPVKFFAGGQQRPGSVHQFSVEPQQLLRYVPQYGQQGRHYQPSRWPQRTELEMPKY